MKLAIYKSIVFMLACLAYANMALAQVGEAPVVAAAAFPVVGHERAHGGVVE